MPATDRFFIIVPKPAALLVVVNVRGAYIGVIEAKDVTDAAENAATFSRTAAEAVAAKLRGRGLKPEIVKATDTPAPVG